MCSYFEVLLNRFQWTSNFKLGHNFDCLYSCRSENTADCHLLIPKHSDVYKGVLYAAVLLYDSRIKDSDPSSNAGIMDSDYALLGKTALRYNHLQYTFWAFTVFGYPKLSISVAVE